MSYGFLRERRWIVASIIVALIAILFVNLGFWQIRRLHWRRGLNATILAQERRPPVSLDGLAGQPLDAMQYRRVTADGSYDTSKEVVLFGRPSASEQQGNEVLTPFTTTGGATLIVNRGWIPLSESTPPVAAAAPPGGTVRITGILLPPESDATTAGPAQGQVKDVNLVELGAYTGRSLLPAYLLLQTQDPPQPNATPVPVPPPALSQGPHFSYAVQWFSFTLIGLIGYAALVHKEAKERQEAAAHVDEPAAQPG